MRLSYYLPLLLAAGLLISCEPSSPQIEKGVSLDLARHRKALISELRYELIFDIPAEQDSAIEAGITIYADLEDNSSDLQLDFKDDTDHLRSILVNDTKIPLRFEQEHLIIPSDFLLIGENEIAVDFIAGNTSLNRNPDYLYTLFVPDRARTAFPLFDQPDLKAVYDLTLEIPSEWEAISNAPVESADVKGNRKILYFGSSDKISSYLFSFVAGDFERITRSVDGREMSMLHRETDEDKVSRNLNDIFRLHSESIAWLEEYTGIPYPFKKFDFALIPTFQYGGMEHVGAIQYRASSLFLDEDPSESQLLGRASLIAHETAHMWFGDLVTMEWFNDVWTKEVFANFMAAKIVNPSFPDINHDLNFLVRHYPSAYGVDRTAGANAIRQDLQNLNEAGQMYGPIIYNKAPIMMRQLEMLVGKETFRTGLQDYLSTYAFKNATWPDLIGILDELSDEDLNSWSEVWVNSPGRPHISMTENQLTMTDPMGDNRIWPQQFEITSYIDKEDSLYVLLEEEETDLPESFTSDNHLLNSDGMGYGLFDSSIPDPETWGKLSEVEKGSWLINIRENLLEGNINADNYLDMLSFVLPDEGNQLLLNLELGHLRSIYWDHLSKEDRTAKAPMLEEMMWAQMLKEEEGSRKKIWFNTFESIGMTDIALEKLYAIWQEEMKIENLNLSENDYTGLAATLAIKMPEQADNIINEQQARISNPDRKRRFEFVKPALSPDEKIRDSFFNSLKEEDNRATESWVLSAIGYLHHPLRTESSVKYILPSLELLQEIQITGDIFFPARWVGTTLGNHRSDDAAEIVRTFLEDHPDYNEQLRMKIMQAGDHLLKSR
ncbi:M1 family metallopeptidase [Balneola sp. MJW-20]|uniref:M1 family metallopeptidase n=1 Tax=Gracilimonas aurantiaca TaxID=3234185 RepID=UPI003466DD60